MIRRAFWNHQERRLRAGWRITLTLLVTALALCGSGSLLQAVPRGPWGPILGMSVQLVLLLALLLGLGAWIDRRAPGDYGFRGGVRWAGELLLGLLLGAVLQSLIFLAVWLAGWAEVRRWEALDGGSTFTTGIITTILAALAAGIGEEALMRGYLLRNLCEGLNLPRVGPRAALLCTWLATSLVFAVLHLGNEHMNAAGFLNIVLAGLLLGLPVLLTGRIALPIGLHIAWNFVEGGVYGFAVSGNTMPASLMITRLTGPPILTGGDFGPEAGLICTLAMALAAPAIWLALARRHPTTRRLAIAEDFASYAGQVPLRPSLESST